jgi:ribosomal protein L31
VETCYQCHPAFNKDKVIKKVVKGRMEKFLEKQKKIDSIAAKPASKKKK